MDRVQTLRQTQNQGTDDHYPYSQANPQVPQGNQPANQTNRNRLFIPIFINNYRSNNEDEQNPQSGYGAS